jgi:PKD repeat protein
VNGIVYIGDEKGYLFALNAATGAKLWDRLLGYEVRSSPAVANGLVYVGYDGGIYAINATNPMGGGGWTFHQFGNWVRSSPAVANGIVYFEDTQGRFYALDATTGAQKWSQTLGYYSSSWASLFIHSSPAVANGVVYVGSLQGNLFALGNVYYPPVAAFTGTPVEGLAPLVVHFTDTSTGSSISLRSWDFGDGQTAAELNPTNPTHNYKNAGTYTVKLTVRTSQGIKSTEVKTGYISVDIPVTVNIAPNPLYPANDGYYIALITLPDPYQATDIDEKSVSCQGMPADKVTYWQEYMPRTFAALWSSEKLPNVRPRTKVTLTVSGKLTHGSNTYGFSGSDEITVISTRETT